MLTFKMIIVFFGLIGMVTALVLDKMRPGMILFSVTVLFLCFGILTPKEILEGFSNKGMITVALQPRRKEQQINNSCQSNENTHPA